MISRALLGLVAAGIASGATAEPIPVVLKDGASWTLKVEHSRLTEQPDRSDAWTVVTTSRLDWRASSDGGGRLTVTPLSAVPLPDSPPEIAKTAAFDIPVVIDVDETLAPTDVVNMAELRAAFATMVRTPDAPPQLRDLADASITALATQNLARLALAQGSDLKLGKTVSYEDESPNPLGGPPIKGIGEARLESVNRKTGVAVIGWRYEFDPQSAAASVATSLQLMLAKVPDAKKQEAAKAFASLSVERHEVCSYQVSLSTGLVMLARCEAEVVSTAAAQTRKRTDRWLFTQSAPELR